MPRPTSVDRILLDEAGKSALDQMITELKSRDEFVRVSPSKLVSWILKRYKEASFEEDCTLLIQAHFDSKEYLRKVVDRLDGHENAADVLNAALKRVALPGVNSGQNRRRPKGKATTESETADSPSQETA